MISGIEIFIGAKFDARLGHLLFIGTGGIYLEIIKDIAYNLAPITIEEALQMISSLKCYPILKGYRNKQGININELAEILVRVSTFIVNNPQIDEMDLNPLIANNKEIKIVDARISIRK